MVTCAAILKFIILDFGITAILKF